MSEVSGDFPSRKKRRSSIHVIDATDANRSAPFKDENKSNVSASPSNAPINSDSGTNGKMYKTVPSHEMRPLGIWKNKNLIIPTEHINIVHSVYWMMVAGF